MSTLLNAFREYGLTSYAMKQAAVSAASLRYVYDICSRMRATTAGLADRSFVQAQHVCQAIRLLEGYPISSALVEMHARVLRQAGISGSGILTAKNALLESYLSSAMSRRDGLRYSKYGADYASRMKFPRPKDDPRRQGNLLVLKAHDPTRGEKGVLYLQYTESIRPFVTLFDIERLAERYRLVVEPSTWGYQDESFLLLVRPGFDVLVQAQDSVDFDYLSGLSSNLIPMRLGAGDWIDPENFVPADTTNKQYDFVMVASWSPVKRHAVFFDALAKAGLYDAAVALIGYPWEGRTSRDIEALALRAGLRSVQIFERIPRAEVATVIGCSRVGVMLTRREGANRGIYECLFCDVPVVLFAGNRGVNKSLVNSMTGQLAADDGLPDALKKTLAGAHTFRPRQWAVQHTGYCNAWRMLDDRLASLAQERGESYATPIAKIRSSPAAAYVLEADRERLEPEYLQLRGMLRSR